MMNLVFFGAAGFTVLLFGFGLGFYYDKAQRKRQVMRAKINLLEFTMYEQGKVCVAKCSITDNGIELTEPHWVLLPNYLDFAKHKAHFDGEKVYYPTNEHLYNVVRGFIASNYDIVFNKIVESHNEVKQEV